MRDPSLAGYAPKVDAAVDKALLQAMLDQAVAPSFNSITVDGDTSTNDACVLLASGASGLSVDDPAGADGQLLADALNAVCAELAEMIVRDGEGATKLVRLDVGGAASAQEAADVAYTVAHSPLVKTALFGNDPNWGRITAAAGRSGAFVDPDKMDLVFGGQPLVEEGRWLGNEAEKKAARLMKADEIDLVLDLNLGNFSDRFLFCDFSENYVKINADYRS